MNKIEEFDQFLDTFIEECYNILEKDENKSPKQIVRAAMRKICKESNNSQGFGIVNLDEVLFEVEDGIALPIFKVEYDDEN